MARSSKKPPFCEPYVLKLVDRVVKSGKLNTLIKIRSRSTVILNKFVGLHFGVYNGKDFISVKVNENMVGRKFGEFSPTRKFTGHSGNKKAVRK